MDKQTLAQVGDFAKKIAKEAGTLSVRLRKEPMGVEEKSSHSDLVTVVDKKVEEFVLSSIQQAYPEHGVLGEEGANIAGGEYVWIVDPIDGTTNFIHGRSYHGVSIALTRQGKGVLGVVCDPILEETFYGDETGHAELNGEPVRIAPASRLSECLVSTTMFYDDPKTKERLHPSIIHLAKTTRGIRMDGCASVNLCHIAVGRTNAYIMPSLQPWDFAAGKIFLEAAGGKVARLDGSEISNNEAGNLLASHPNVFEEISQLYK